MSTYAVSTSLLKCYQKCLSCLIWFIICIQSSFELSWPKCQRSKSVNGCSQSSRIQLEQHVFICRLGQKPGPGCEMHREPSSWVRTVQSCWVQSDLKVDEAYLRSQVALLKAGRPLKKNPFTLSTSSIQCQQKRDNRQPNTTLCPLSSISICTLIKKGLLVLLSEEAQA